MKRRDASKNLIPFVVAVILNIIVIYLVISSVIFSISQFNESSFTQNVENIKTLTDSSANKIGLVIEHYCENVRTTADYINNYHDVGMTEEEIDDFFEEYYGGKEYNWQLIDNVSSNGDEPSRESFDGKMLLEHSDVSYRCNYYPTLASVFCEASEETLSEINYINEFTDASRLSKSFGVSSYVRVRQHDKTTNGDSYIYKTLLMVVKSEDINKVIASNNNINNLDFFNYTNVIIDQKGDYMFSNEHFQGQNFLRYLETYDNTLTKEDKENLLENLKNKTAYEPIYYKNNNGQSCIYTVSQIDSTDWFILSSVPLESFHNANHFSGSYIRFFLSLTLLFVIDITFILLINRKLRRKSKEAEAASIAKSQFLSSMSHDIRTPMNAIIGMTFIARENLEEDTPDKETLKDCIKTIELSGNHLLTLINDILDISKIESGKVALSADNFSISESISKMLEIIQPQIAEKHFEFETHLLNVNHEFVHADELRINQIYINILSNAIKYTNPGGKITVDLCEEELPSKTGAARFIYRVSDTGIGMDEEFRKTIFDRFTRAVDTRINTIQGSGLGMTIVKQLVDMMGGTITVESELNKGSVFTVKLDLPVSDARSESVSLHGMSALLIDDDAILLETAGIILKKAGMTVDITTTGQEGIKMALSKAQAGSAYDVILVDWKMSELDGASVVRALRSDPCFDAKIVVMNAYGIADIEREARKAGANGFITKPLFQTKLLYTLQSLFVDAKRDTEHESKTKFNLKVLVAEDNHVNWRVMEKLLSRYGIQADRAENGKVALEQVRDSAVPYNLVLMDIQMPHMNGYEATEAIRSLDDPVKSSVVIYAMTADTFAEDVERCLRKGMDGHLSKPIDVDKLLKVITQVSQDL